MTLRRQDQTAGSYPAGSYDDGREDVAQVIAQEHAERERRPPAERIIALLSGEPGPRTTATIAAYAQVESAFAELRELEAAGRVTCETTPDGHHYWTLRTPAPNDARAYPWGSRDR